MTNPSGKSYVRVNGPLRSHIPIVQDLDSYVARTLCQGFYTPARARITVQFSTVLFYLRTMIVEVTSVSFTKCSITRLFVICPLNCYLFLKIHVFFSQCTDYRSTRENKAAYLQVNYLVTAPAHAVNFLSPTTKSEELLVLSMSLLNLQLAVTRPFGRVSSD